MSETQVTTESQSVDTDNLDTFATEFFGEKTKADPKDAKPEEVAQDEQPTDDAKVDTEAQTEDTDPNAQDPEAEYKEAPPKKKTVQDRIDEVVKQREDQRREFEAKFAELEAKLAEKSKTTTEAAKSPEPSPDDVNEDGTPKYALGEFDPQYVRDLTKFTFAQERAAAAKEAEINALVERETEARNALTSDWNTRVEAAKAEYPDFTDKAQTMLNSLGNLPDDYAGYLGTVIMSMDHGTDVLYYLSNNPEEAVKIVNSGAQKATLALGRIEAKFFEAAQEKQAAKPKVSKAPPPPAERARGTNGAFVSVAPDTDDLDAFTTEFFRKKG